MKKIQFLLVLVISIVSMSGFCNALSLEAIIPIINGWSASEASNGVKVVKDLDNYYICNSGNLSNCNKKNASTWVKYEKGLNRGDKYYVCNASSSSCNSMSHSSIIYQQHEAMEFDGYYVCSSSSCFFNDSNTKINKISGSSDNEYYICQGGKYKCGKDNATYRVRVAYDTIYVCKANVSYCKKENASKIISKSSVSGNGSSSSSSNNTDFSWLVADLEEELADVNKVNSYFTKGLNAAMANDYKTAITNQIEVVKIYKSLYKSNKNSKDLLADSYSYLGLYYCFDKNYTNAEKAYQLSLNLVNDSKVKADYEECMKEKNSQSSKPKCTGTYGPNSFLADDGLCYCKNGYTWNEEDNYCVAIVSNNNYNYNDENNKKNSFSQEYNNAYQFAFANKITTMPTIEQANMNSPIIRAEIAKMLSNWMKSLGYAPDTSKSCKFNDISSVKGDLYTAIIESCQLGIMGQGISNYRPYDTITRGEVSTAISRILWGSQYEGGDPFYRNHMNALRNIGVLDNLNNPNTNELRGNVMVMLMRASYSDEIVNCDDPVTSLACAVEPSQCPKECLEENNEEIIEKNLNDSNKEAEAFSGYMVSVAKLIKEVQSQTKFKKNFNDLTHNEIIEEIKSHIKTVKSDKDKLLELGPWKGDGSLIDEVISYAELNILRLNQMIEAEGLLVEINKLQDSYKTDDLEKLREEGKIIGENLDKYKKDVENKYEDLRNVFNGFYKKYQPK